MFAFWSVTNVLILMSRQLYHTKREIVETFEIWEVLKSIALATCIVVVSLYALRMENFPRSILLIGTGLMMILLTTWRVMKRVFVEYLVANGYNNFNVVIIGAGKVGKTLYQEIRKRPSLGLKVIGFLDDFKEGEVVEGGPQVIGKISDFAKIVRSEFIDQAFIATHQDSLGFLKLLKKAQEVNVSIRVIPHGFEFMSRDFLKYNIGFVPVLEYSNQSIYRKQFGKRMFDFFAGLILNIVCLPIYIGVAILIKMDSPGPIFYASKRYGRGGKMFNMYKFRSMVTNADDLLQEYKEKNEVDGPIFKMRSDPRITKLGRILRKYSIDELPQLVNVLKGDMSLVGPRPLPIEQVQKEDFKQLRRLEVRPGITGLWQIRGRSDISFKRLIRWDIWYINNWSFWLDLNILLQTIPVVCKGKGAY